MRELEMKMRNLMSSVFETVTTVQDGVRVLDSFRPFLVYEVTTASMTHSTNICHLRFTVNITILFQAFNNFLQEKAEQVYSLFREQLRLVNKELSQRKLSCPDHMSRTIGQVVWAKNHRRLLDEHYKVSSSILKAFFTNILKSS